MRVALTGGTGIVGRFVLAACRSAGDRVTLLGRRPVPGAECLPYELGGRLPDLSGQDALVHCAFSHVAGRYRGGEGDDPAGFEAANLAGSLRLFEAAAEAGLGRILFLSSRAVYGGYPPGTRLLEAMEPRPDTLYGEVKARAEAALAELPGGMSLRATGVYGPPGPDGAHKWRDLFEDFAAGRPIAPRVATEVHGADLGVAARLLLATGPRGGRVFNASDLVLDRRDLLADWARISGRAGALPERAEAGAVSEMDCARLRALGWRPAGRAGLEAALARIAGAPPPRNADCQRRGMPIR